MLKIRLNKLQKEKVMRFLCEHLQVEDIGLRDPNEPDGYTVDRDKCPDCPDYETCKEDGYLKAIDKKLGRIQAERHEKPVKQGSVENKQDDEYFRKLVSFIRTPLRARLSEQAKLWGYRLDQKKGEGGISLSSEEVAEIAGLLGLIPRLLEAQAMAEIGLKQAERFDEAGRAYHGMGKSVPGLRKAARLLGLNTGKKEAQFSDQLFLYEYISLVEKYGKTTEGKKRAAQEMQEKYNIQSYEATVQRLKRARKKELKKKKDTKGRKKRGRRSELAGILPNEWPSGLSEISK